MNKTFNSWEISLRVEVHHYEPKPAANYTNSRVCTGEHQWQEFEATPKNYSMQQRTIGYQRDRKCNVHKRESVQKEDPRMG